jgi:hypothetical protein
MANAALARTVTVVTIIPRTGPGSGSVSAQEVACQQGEPPSEAQILNARSHADQLMSEYSRLTPTSQASDLSRVFNLRDFNSFWRDETGLVPLKQIPTHLRAPAPTLQPVSFIVGGDGESAHGVWQATSGGAGAKTTWYVAEFRVLQGWNMFPGWKIWRMAIVQSDAPPALPAPFCHLTPDASW